jgi:hypothetical protein
VYNNIVSRRVRLFFLCGIDRLSGKILIIETWKRIAGDFVFP